MGIKESSNIDPEMKLSTLRQIISQNYSWINNFEFDKKHTIYNFWYRSAEKEEPRLGQRFRERGSENEIKVNPL